MKSFQKMPLAAELQKALTNLKFVEPTEVQSAVLPMALEGRDLMACAETGSGKTAAYGIPAVSKLLEDPKKNALILAPTRELAQQISEFMRELCSYCDGFYVTSLVGGADMRKQLQALKRKPRVIVATPGRLIDHLKRRSVKLSSTGILILDEGDRMLDMGFSPQLDEILEHLPKERQSFLFTATLPEKVRKLANKYLSNPARLDIGRTSLPVASIKQSVVQVKMKEKDDRIVDELNQREGSVIVFAKTKIRTDNLARVLSEYGFSVDLIHGGRTQGQRNKAIRNFKMGRSRILCATDVAARGIDVPQVEHVINFDLPMMDEDYVHRIGRTARNGAKGEAVSFVTPGEHRTWQALARKYKIQGVELKDVFQGRDSRSRSDRSRSDRSRSDYGSSRGSSSRSNSYSTKRGESSFKRRGSDDSPRGESFKGRGPDESRKGGTFRSRYSEDSPRGGTFRSRNSEDSPSRGRSFRSRGYDEAPQQEREARYEKRSDDRKSGGGRSSSKKKTFSRRSEESSFYGKPKGAPKSKLRGGPGKRSEEGSEDQPARSFKKKRFPKKKAGSAGAKSGGFKKKSKASSFKRKASPAKKRTSQRGAQW